MLTVKHLLLPALAVSLAGAAQGQKINWGPCHDVNSTQPVVCANFTVPLDYTNPNSNTTIQLELVKVPASVTPSKGSIFFNFGGPGFESRQTMGITGKLFLE